MKKSKLWSCAGRTDMNCLQTRQRGRWKNGGNNKDNNDHLVTGNYEGTEE